MRAMTAEIKQEREKAHELRILRNKGKNPKAVPAFNANVNAAAQTPFGEDCTFGMLPEVLSDNSTSAEYALYGILQQYIGRKLRDGSEWTINKSHICDTFINSGKGTKNAFCVAWKGLIAKGWLTMVRVSAGRDTFAYVYSLNHVPNTNFNGCVTIRNGRISAIGNNRVDLDYIGVLPAELQEKVDRIIEQRHYENSKTKDDRQTTLYEQNSENSRLSCGATPLSAEILELLDDEDKNNPLAVNAEDRSDRGELEACYKREGIHINYAPSLFTLNKALRHFNTLSEIENIKNILPEAIEDGDVSNIRALRAYISLVEAYHRVGKSYFEGNPYCLDFSTLINSLYYFDYSVFVDCADAYADYIRQGVYTEGDCFDEECYIVDKCIGDLGDIF